MSRHRKPRRKAYRPKPKHAPMLIASELVLRPVDQIIEQLARDGTVNVDERGNPQFQAGDGCWYDAAAGIEGVIWHFEMWCTRHGRDLPLQPLRELQIALKYIVPIMPKTITELVDAMPILRLALALADGDDAVDILQQTQIKVALETHAA
jgi:hypothetical protein